MNRKHEIFHVSEYIKDAMTEVFMKRGVKPRERKPFPCKCGCGKLIVPVRLDDRGNWSRETYFSDECRRMSYKNRRKDNNQHVAGEKDKMRIHPIIDTFLRRPA